MSGAEVQIIIGAYGCYKLSSFDGPGVQWWAAKNECWRKKYIVSEGSHELLRFCTHLSPFEEYEKLPSESI